MRGPSWADRPIAARAVEPAALAPYVLFTSVMVQAPKLPVPNNRMGGTATLSKSQREGWLWNIAKGALPEGSTDADVLHYMRFLAKENGLQLDANNDLADTPANRAKLNKPIAVSAYPAPTAEAMKGGAKLYPGMSGPAVTQLKQRLNTIDPSLKLDATSDVYDAATKKAVQDFLQKNGTRVRKDGVIGADAVSKINNPNTQTTDTVERTNDPSKVAPNVKTNETDRNPTLNTLETNEQFAKLDPRKQRLVRRAMQNQPQATQERIADVASQPNFARLATGYQQKVLDLAKSEDPASNALAQKMVKSDLFVQADGNVKAQIAELLEQDPRFAADVSKVLDISNEDVVEERDAQLVELAKLAISGPTAEREPKTLAQLKETEAFKKLPPAAQQDVEARLANMDDKSVPLAAKLATHPSFAKLAGAEREHLLFLAEEASPALADALTKVLDSEAFLEATPPERTQLLSELEAKRDDPDAILKVLEGLKKRRRQGMLV